MPLPFGSRRKHVADDGRTDEHYRNHRESAAQVAMARRAGAELVRSAGRACAANSAIRRLFPDPHCDSVRESNQIRLPLGEGKTSPVAVGDVARVIVALLANTQPHIGTIYHLTGPESENMHFYAQEYSKALGRTITYQDIPVEPWQDALLKRGLPIHLVNHLATMADLHRAGRYDRLSDDVLTLTGQMPMSTQEVVRKNATTFTDSAKAA
jgi:hypothetical protein